MDNTKTCTKCFKIKLVTDFSRDRTKSSGYLPSCKKCKSDYDRRMRPVFAERHKANSLWQRKNCRKSLGESKAKYRKKHLEYYKEQAKKRYRMQKLATPKWLTKEQLAFMKNMYIEAKDISRRTGIKHCVDHIVPIINYNVSGLHVPWNLRIITVIENSEKNNKLIT